MNSAGVDKLSKANLWDISGMNTKRHGRKAAQLDIKEPAFEELGAAEVRMLVLSAGRLARDLSGFIFHMDGSSASKRVMLETCSSTSYLSNAA